ncbi:MAG: type II toxin-antitoxin system VapC family toxin [Silvibacterium sp.]
MRVLIDAHALIWATVEPHRISPRARQLLSHPEHELLFSMVSLWELSLKISNGKLTPLGASITDVIEVLKQRGAQLLPIRIGHIVRLESLPLHHRDPFDRLLVAQALEEDLAILSSDRLLHQYSAKIVW